MGSLVLVAPLAALLVVLHLAVAAYLYRVALSSDDRQVDADTATHADTATDERAEPSTDRRPNAVETTPCPTCGAPNDPSYRFCRRCVADLSGQRAEADGVAAGRLGS